MVAIIGIRRTHLRKRVDRAIALSLDGPACRPIAAKITPDGATEREIEPLAVPNVSFLGEIADEEKAALLAARAPCFRSTGRAVRHGRDRGAVLRNAGHRLESRVGA